MILGVLFNDFGGHFLMMLGSLFRDLMINF